MSEKIEPELMSLACWIIGGLAFAFVLALVLLFAG